MPPRQYSTALLVLFASSLACLSRAVPVSADALEFGWTAEGFIDPAAGEGQRVQLALDAAGVPTAIWSGRATTTQPFALLSSTLSGGTWSTAALFLPAVAVHELLPQVSRAPDGTLWLAWLRYDDSVGSSNLLYSTLVCARFADGAWSTPEVVTTGMGRPNRSVMGIEFSILGVSRDSAWIAFMPVPVGNPLSVDRDLYYSAHSASGWNAPAVLSGAGFAEWRPVLVPGVGGQPIAFFGYRNEATTLEARRWDGASWIARPEDAITALAFYAWAAAPDSSGAIRLLVMQREDDGGGLLTDRIREFTWNEAGFTPLAPIAELPVVAGQGAIPPQWDGLAYTASDGCPICVGSTALPRFRGFWVDYSLGSIPIVTSIERTAGGFGLPEIVGTALAPDEAYPNGVYDGALGRWDAVWVGAPSVTAVRRAKFAWTQTFAGDLGIGGRFIAPDTVRVTVACTGEGAGRTFRIYRLRWDDTENSPPFAPPIPAAAVELAGSPWSGSCPFRIDDLPGDGRWFYYVGLEPQGTFPERAARSFTPIVIGGGGGGTPPARTAFRAPRPRPSTGVVSLPFDLANAGDVVLSVRDLFGRPRRKIALGAKAAGSYVSSAAPQWDGIDDVGREVPTGVYFVRLIVDRQALASERVVIVR